MKRTKKALALVIVLAVVLPLAATFLIPVPDPLPSAVANAEYYRVSIAATVFFAWLHIGSALLFLIGLKDFKPRLKRAYAMICLGLVSIGIALVQVPVFIALSLFESGWVHAGFLPLPYAIAAFLLFLGVRSFAGALSDQSVWVRAGIMVSGVLLLTLVAFVATNSFRPAGEAVEVAGGLWGVLFTLITLVIALRIRRVAGPAYTNALAWFCVSLAVSVVGFGAPAVYKLLGIEQDVMLAIPVTIAGIAYVRAGYAFSKIGEY